MSNPEVQRIKNDLARAKERVTQIENGQRGVRPSVIIGPRGSENSWLDTDGNNPGAGLAYSAQLKAQRDAVARLELELVQAMIPHPWTPAEVIERMGLQRVPVDRPANNADVMTKVREIVSSLPETATIQSLKELIA